jgi:sortase A
MKYQGTKKQQAMIQQFQKTIEKVDKNPDESPNMMPPSDSTNTLGILIIPKINLKVSVSEGVDLETLKYAVGHFKGSAMPGEKGNFCVAGHRSYTYSEFFNRLDEVQPGDYVIVRTRDGEFKYKIFQKEVVKPTEVSVLNATKDSTITLITCTPIHIATHRLILKGRLCKN